MGEASPEVVVVGGGVAGLTAAMFTARAGLDTEVFEYGGSILKRNAHLENFPGFPAGINARRFLDLLERQAVENDVRIRRDRVAAVEPTEEGFTVTGETDTVEVRRVIAACWPNADMFDALDLTYVEKGSKRFVRCGPDGGTDVDGFFVAGRLSGREHQAIVSAGSGAEVGLAAARDAGAHVYHDWVTPEGYFTERGREVPSGCEEIAAEERRRREERARRVFREAFDRPYGEAPRQHPSLED